MGINSASFIPQKNNLNRKTQFSRNFVNNCLRMASVVAIAAAASSSAFSASLASLNLDQTGTPVLFRPNPVTSSAINFPAVTIAGGTVGALNYYFGASGTATTGVTLNQGTIALTVGSVTGATAATPGTFTYKPAPNFSGTDTFMFYMQDTADLASVAYTVTMLVGDPLSIETETQPVEFALTPVATTLSHFVAAGGVSPYTYSVTVPPVHGSLSATNTATPTYTPEDLYYGPDHFYYSVTDSATPPAIVSGRFDLKVQAQGI